MKRTNSIYKMVLAALFLALAYVLPFLTGQIQEIGAMLCPMHLPVLLCGFFAGPFWGALIGAVAPLLRSLMLGMPLPFPNAVCMAAELLTYGFIAGALHRLLPHKKPFVYLSLLCAMIAGRIVWGGAMFVCVGIQGSTFTLSAFLAGAITGAIPGIIVQIVLVPLLVILLDFRDPKKKR